MPIIVIVESPAKAKTINKYLGDGYKVLASVGHFRDLPKSELGLNDEFKPRYEITKPDVFNKIKSACQGNQVILLSDLDREGEAIAWHLVDALNLKDGQYVRCGLTEITEKSVLAAVKQPRGIDYALVHAQEARRVIDRLIGYKASRPISRALGARSAGRVQTAATMIVVARQRLINKFSRAQYYDLKASLAGVESQVWVSSLKVSNFIESGDFEAALTPLPIDQKDTASVNRHICDKGLINTIQKEVFKRNSLHVTGFTSSQVTSKAPPALTTSTLLQAASVQLGMPSETSMAIAQSLYERGLISYHRTDDPNPSDETIVKINEFIDSWQKAERKTRSYKLNTPNRYKISDDAQAGHEAIRPTDLYNEGSDLSAEDASVYRLIRNRIIGCQMANAEFQKTTATLSAGFNIGKTPVEFEASGRILIFDGWRQFAVADTKKENEQNIPNLHTGLEVKPKQVYVETKNTRPPPHYTEATLVKQLEKEGIARPSTFASTIKTIKDRKYISFDKLNINATTLAMKMIEGLESNFQFSHVDYSNEVESRLDEIASGKNNFKSIVTAVNDSLEKELTVFKQKYKDKIATVQCPNCKDESLMKYPKKTDKKSFVWACQSDKNSDCETFFPDVNGKPDLNYKPPATSDYDCPKCGVNKLTLYAKKEEATQRWWGCSLRKCNTLLSSTANSWDTDTPVPDFIKWKINNSTKCPACHKFNLNLNKAETTFYCTNNKCKTFVGVIVANDLKQPDIEKWKDDQIKAKEAEANRIPCPKCRKGSLLLANSGKTFYCSSKSCKTFLKVTTDKKPDFDDWNAKLKLNNCPNCCAAPLKRREGKDFFYCVSTSCKTFTSILEDGQPDIDGWHRKQAK